MKQYLKKHWALWLAVIAIPLGNRIFNHVDAWLGVAIIVAAISYLIYKLIISNNEKKI